MSIPLSLWLVAALARADEACPVGTHEAEAESGCQLCVDNADATAGVLRYPGGESTYELAFAGTTVQRMQRLVQGEPPTLQIADLRSGGRASEEVCGIKLNKPTPSPSGLRWEDAAGAVLIIEQYWGWAQRNLRNLYAMPDGSFDVVGARRYPAPGAHMNNHWTDGYYHRRTLGRWRHTLEDGSVESGQWAKGEPVGLWTVVAKDGRVAERGSYVRGYPTGRWRCEAADGVVTSGRYRLGRWVGDWVTTDAQGGVVSKVTHVPTDDAPQIRGRHWRGGMLSSKRVRSPCAVLPPRLDFVTTPDPTLLPGQVRIRVMDDDDLELPGVLLLLDGDIVTAVTDADGAAVLGSLTVGIHELALMKQGFERIKGRFTVDGAAATGAQLTLVMGTGG